jgi:hypothetical protein
MIKMLGEHFQVMRFPALATRTPGGTDRFGEVSSEVESLEVWSKEWRHWSGNRKTNPPQKMEKCGIYMENSNFEMSPFIYGK